MNNRNDYDHNVLPELCGACNHYWERKMVCCLEKEKLLTLRVRIVPGSARFVYERDVLEASCTGFSRGSTNLGSLSLDWFQRREMPCGY